MLLLRWVATTLGRSAKIIVMKSKVGTSGVFGLGHCRWARLTLNTKLPDWMLQKRDQSVIGICSRVGDVPAMSAA